MDIGFSEGVSNDAKMRLHKSTKAQKHQIYSIEKKGKEVVENRIVPTKNYLEYLRKISKGRIKCVFCGSNKKVRISKECKNTSESMQNFNTSQKL